MERNGFEGRIVASEQKISGTEYNGEIELSQFFKYSDISEISQVYVGGSEIADFSSGKINVGTNESVGYTIYLSAESSYERFVSGTMTINHSGKITFPASVLWKALNDSFTITPTIRDSENAAVTWTSSVPSVATVDENGTVTTVGEGETVITAVLEGEETPATCTVHVVELKSLTLDKNSIYIDMAKETGELLTVTLDPENFPGTVAWSSSNTEVAAVYDNGKVQAIGTGICTVTASVGPLSASCTVAVENPLTLKESDICLYIGQEAYELEPVLSENYKDAEITIFEDSSRDYLDIVQNGNTALITPKCTGYTTVWVYLKKGDVSRNATMDIHINTPSLSVPELTEPLMYVGEEKNISASVYPGEFTLLWESSDENVVTVDNGTATAAGPGTAAVTVSVKEIPGLTKSVELIVRNKYSEYDIINNNYFADEAFIRKLQKLFPDTLTVSNVSGVESLDLGGTKISNFKGLELFTGLKELNLSGSGYTWLNLSDYASMLTGVNVHLDQTVTADVFGYVVEMKELLNGGNLEKVSIDAGTGTLDTETGFLTLAGKPESFTYSYDTGAGMMKVTVNINSIVPTLPEETLTELYSSWFYLTVSLSDSDSYTYQWQLSTDDGATYSDIEGKTENSICLYATEDMNGWLYRCLATSEATGAAVPSNASKICITDILSGVVFQPVSYFGEDGDTVKWSVEPEDTESSVSYQWFSAPSDGQFVEIEDATSSEYSFMLTASNSGTRYYCVVTRDGSETRTDEVSATIGAGTTITDDGVLAEAGETVTINPGLKSGIVRCCHYRWEKSTDGKNFCTVEDATSYVLSTTVTAADHGTVYRMVVWDDYGHSVTSRDFVINIKGETVRLVAAPEEILLDQYNGYRENVVIAAGEGLEYTCSYYFPDGVTKFYESSGNGIDYYSQTIVGSKVKFTVIDASGNSVSTGLIPVTCDSSRYAYVTVPENAVGGLINVTSSLDGFHSAMWQISSDGSTWTDIPSDKITTQWENNNRDYSNLPSFYTLSRLMLDITDDSMDGYKLRCVFTDGCENQVVSSSGTISLQEGAYGIVFNVPGHPEIGLRNSVPYYACPGDTVTVTLPAKSYSSVTVNGEKVKISSSWTYTFTMPEEPVVITDTLSEGNSEISFSSLNPDAFPIYAKWNPDVNSSTVRYSKDASLTVKPGTRVSLRLYTGTSADTVMINNVYIWVNNGAGETPVDYTVEDGYYSFTAPEGTVMVVAEFKTADIKITVQQSQHGTVEILDMRMSNQPPYVNYSLWAYPDEGYTVDCFLVDGVETEPVRGELYSGRTKKDITVSARFVKAKYEITKQIVNIQGIGSMAIAVNGELSTESSVKACAGDQIVVYMTPSSGYRAQSVYDNFNNVKAFTKLAPTVFAFTMPATDVYLRPVFTEIDPWDQSTYGKPVISIPEALQCQGEDALVEYTLDEDNRLTVSITGDEDGWAQVCGDEESGFITLGAVFTAPAGTVKSQGGYKNIEVSPSNLNSIAVDPELASAAAEGDTTVYKLKIATYSRNSDGTITIVPLSDGTAEEMRGVYQIYGDLNDITLGISYFNFHLNPKIVSAFTVTDMENDSPAGNRITWLYDSEKLSCSYSEDTGRATVSPKEGYVNDVTVASQENNLWNVCTIEAPDGYVFSSVTDSLDENCCLCGSSSVTIRKPVAAPYSLNDVTAPVSYLITWVDGNNNSSTITEKFTLSVSGEILFSKNWNPASVRLKVGDEIFELAAGISSLKSKGIDFAYDTASGQFSAGVSSENPPDLQALSAKAYIEIPENASCYKTVSGYGSSLYNTAFAITGRNLLDSGEYVEITGDTVLTFPLFEIKTNTLGEVDYVYSSNLDMRYSIYEFYDSEKTVVGSAYVVGQSGAFIFGEVTGGITDLDALNGEAVTSPVIVGSTDSLKVMYYPQESESTEYLLDIEPVEDTDGKAVTVYLPYSLTGKTYEELKGQTITVYHYPDENDTSKVEELEGECTEYGIKVVMTSFSPIVLDWSKLQRHTVAVQSRSEGTTESVATLKGGGNISIQTGTTLTAPDRKGYEFVGWFTGYSASSNGTLVSSAHTFNYKPVEDIVLTAVYKSSEVTYSLDIDASLYSIKGMQGTESTEEGPVTYKALETVTITYTDTGKTFLYWANESGKIVSKSKEYTFLLGSNTKLHAVCAETGDGSACVVFLTSYNQVLSAQSYTSQDTIAYPDNPSKLGYTFDKWVFADTEAEATQETVTARISKGEDNTISIVPTFTKNADTYNLTVESRYGNSLLNTETIENIVKGDLQKVTAGEFDGYVFQHWELNGEILNYSLSFNFLSSATTADTVTITAVYGTEEVEETALVRITEVVPGRNGEKYRLSFTEYFNVPEGCTMVSAGFVMTTDSTKATESDMTLGAEGLKTYTMEGTAKFGTYTMHLNTKNSGLVIYMRGYVQYLDKDENVFTIYSDIAGSSYDALAGTDNDD